MHHYIYTLGIVREELFYPVPPDQTFHILPSGIAAPHYWESRLHSTTASHLGINILFKENCGKVTSSVCAC